MCMRQKMLKRVMLMPLSPSLNCTRSWNAFEQTSGWLYTVVSCGVSLIGTWKRIFFGNWEFINMYNDMFWKGSFEKNSPVAMLPICRKVGLQMNNWISSNYAQKNCPRELWKNILQCQRSKNSIGSRTNMGLAHVSVIYENMCSKCIGWSVLVWWATWVKTHCTIPP